MPLLITQRANTCISVCGLSRRARPSRLPGPGRRAGREDGPGGRAGPLRHGAGRTPRIKTNTHPESLSCQGRARVPVNPTSTPNHSSIGRDIREGSQCLAAVEVVVLGGPSCVVGRQGGSGGEPVWCTLLVVGGGAAPRCLR